MNTTLGEYEIGDIEVVAAFDVAEGKVGLDVADAIVPLPECHVHVGPSDFMSRLTDRKWAYIRLEGTTFGGLPLNAELKLEVWDSPDSAMVRSFVAG